MKTVDLLIRCDAFPDSTFLWWDVRPQPKFGTVEIRVMDAQSTPEHTGALTTFVQAIARLELEEGYHSQRLIDAPEVLAENRFLAARDGMEALLIDPILERRVPAREQLADLLKAARPHADDLGFDLDGVGDLAERGGAELQRSLAGPERRLDIVLERMSELFADSRVRGRHTGYAEVDGPATPESWSCANAGRSLTVRQPPRLVTRKGTRGSHERERCAAVDRGHHI